MAKPVILISSGQETDASICNIIQRRFYSKCVENFGGVPLIAAFSGTEELAEMCSGLILSGGTDIAPFFFGEKIESSKLSIDHERDDYELLLMDAFYKKKKPVLGICRGIQVINVYFGGTIFQDIGDIHNETFHNIKICTNSILESILGNECLVNSYHHQTIKTLGKDLIVSAVSDDSVVEGIEHRNGSVIGVQWHPERMTSECKIDEGDNMDYLFERFIRICNKEK